MQFLVVLIVLILGLIKIAMDLHFKKKNSFRHVQILKLLDYFHFIFFLLFYVILGHKFKLNLI